jgi:trafficking protein particle complex subunit 9
VPQVIYSETVIRHARILQLIRASGGSLTPPDLQHVIEGLRKPAAVPSNLVGEHASSPSRIDVANFVYRAMPQPGGEEFIETSDFLRILAGVASVLSDLNFQRKKGLVLRELVATLLPALVQSRKDSAAELGLHPAASFEAASSASYATLGQTHSVGGGAKAFLTVLCDIYGVIQIQHDSFRGVGYSHDEYEDMDAIARRALDSAVRRTYGNPLLKIDILRSCINVCEALPDLTSLLQFSGSLLRTAGSGLAPGPFTTDSAPSLPMEDQVRLSTNISRAVSAAKQLGVENAEADYWDEFLVRDIGLTAGGSSPNPPLPRQKADLDLAKATTATETKDGPFIFNPFAAKPATASKDILLVVNEEAMFVLLLQNLYDMDLEIEWIKFDNDDIAVDASVKDIVIGPYRTQNVQVLCTPRKAGKLSLSGCIAKVKGCRPRRFPLFRSPWRMRDPLKLKRHGLSAAAADTEQPAQDSAEGQKASKQSVSELPAPATFDALVIEAQPTLVLKSSSLPQSALMILDGEARTFSITLKNASETPIDLFLVSLDDSTVSLLHTAVADKDLSPAELYELELNAQSRPALRVVPHSQGEDISIAPQDELVLEVEVFGKIGLTHGSINIEYSHLSVPRSEIQAQFFTRRLAVPFEVTVNSSLGLLYNDVLPLPSDAMDLLQAGPDMKRDELSDLGAAQHFYNILQQWRLEASNLDYCLLMVDFNNAWSEPISFTLQLQHPTNGHALENTAPEPYKLTTLVQPSRTARVVVPFPKLLLEDPHAPVPSLDPRHKRQYVVSGGSKTRPDAERLARELFWYREEVLKYLEASWTVQSRGYMTRSGSDPGARHGMVDLRRLSITPRMLESLRQDDLVITLNLVQSDTENRTQKPLPARPGASHFRMRAGDFVTLETTLHSRVSYRVQPLLRLQPALRYQPYHVALDLGRKVAVNGVLQKALPILAPGQTHRIGTGLAFLAPGEYEVAALVEEVRILPDATDHSTPAKPGQRKRSDTADLELGEVGKRTERRAWYCRQACLVDVIGADEDNS